MTTLTTAANVKRSTLARIARLLKPWRWWLAAILATMLAGSALELVPPLVVKWLIDNHLEVGRSEGIALLAMMYLGARAAMAGLGFATTYLAAATAQRALHRLRVSLFDHLQRLPIPFYDRTPTGEIISRCTSDIETVEAVFSTGVVRAVTDTCHIVAWVAAMLVLSPMLTAVACVGIPPIALTTWYLQSRALDAQRASRRAVGTANAHLHEILVNTEVIRTFAREPHFVARFRAALAAMVRANNRAAACSSAFSPLTMLSGAAATALVLWVAVNRSVPIGTLTAFLLMLREFFKPVRRIGNELQTVQRAIAGIERIAETLTLPAEPVPQSYGPTDAGADPIELKDVRFGYVDGHPVLNGISLVVRRGEHVALVGRTGAGKSSLLHLLGGLYEPWSGAVRLAGMSPRARHEDDRRKIVGAVPQVVQLLSGTVRDNITLRDDSVSDEAVRRAAAICGMDEFICSLPEGYETLLASRGGGLGMQLSAGQRQLLALARALVHQPPVLLLDEATAAIDNESEATLHAAMRSEAAGSHHAILTAAHRLSTAARADRIVLLEAGQIVEQGSPQELLRRGGRFAALLELEAAGWDWHDGPTPLT
jgi:ATP-binding cassette, subfamily B, multidrug efflux pump